MQTEEKQSIRAEHLIKRYSKRTVVNDVSLELKEGEIVGLLGPNGAGKTTSFYMMVGMVKPSEGNVYLNDKKITSMAMYRRARLGVSYLPQEASIFRKLSVENNILAILQLQSMKRSERKERLEQLLEDFRITHIRKSKGYMLSGGERRRCEIARALASDPKFIFLDEPFAGIDPITVEEIMHLVKKLKEKGISCTGSGNGPVNAFDNALRSGLKQLYPELEVLELTDYKVRILEGRLGTGAITRVLVETSDGKGEWNTVGVHENVIAASAMALEDAVTFGLLRQGRKPE